MKHNDELAKLIAGIKESVGTEPLHEIGDQIGISSIGKGDIESQLRAKPDAYLEQVARTPMSAAHGSAALRILGERANAQPFDASGGFGPRGLWDKIPAPGLIAPEIPFDPSGGFGPTGPAETIPAPDLLSISGPDLLPLGSDQNTPSKSFPELRPLDYEGISPAKASTKSSRSSPRPAKAPKAPPVASQVPPDIEDAGLAPDLGAEAAFSGLDASIAGAGIAIGIGSHVINATKATGSIHDFLPGGSGGTNSGDGSLISSLAALTALNKLASISSRA